MVCLYCSKNTQVTNSRLQRRANQVWRRRQCLSCSRIFTSLEAIDLSGSLKFITSQNVGEPFSRDKLFISIYESVRHRPRSDSDASALTSTIISKIKPHIHEAAIKRNDLVQTVAAILKNFDKAAYTYYSAYHPTF